MYASDAAGVRKRPLRPILYKHIVNPHDDLAIAIVEQAILDYMTVVQRKRKRKHLTYYGKLRIQELREFFLSTWCDSLLGSANISGKYILEMLEKELERE